MKLRELLRASQEKPMNLLQRYRDMSAPVKASAWYAVCDVIQKGILVLTIPIFTRIMTTAEYGLTNVYNSWLAIIVIFATLNLQHGTFNMAMVEFEDDRDKYISAVQGLVTTSVMVLFLIYLPLSVLIPSSSGLATLSVPVVAPLGQFAGVGGDVVVTAFQSACGLVNLVTPTAAVVMGALALGRIPYEKWLKFVWKLMLLFLLLTGLLLVLAAALS